MSATVKTIERAVNGGQAKTSPKQKGLTIALAGNPNAGKTTLFNALTGLRQKVANYPGVTVERKEGKWRVAADAPAARLIDLPGLYSLDASSLDEQIARDVITGRIPGLPAPDVIVAVVDATNLQRNLYLTTQILDYGRPVVVALTMYDSAQNQNLELDAETLAEQLGVPVVPVVAAQHKGLDELSRAVERAAQTSPLPTENSATDALAPWRMSAPVEAEITALQNGASGNPLSRREALDALFGTDTADADADFLVQLFQTRSHLTKLDANWKQAQMLARYEWINRALEHAAPPRVEHHTVSVAEKIDRILTHKIFGLGILFLVLLLIFQAIFSWAQAPMDLIDAAFSALQTTVKGALPPGLLTDLLTDGVIAGVGGVVIFLPQILLLFLFISILEDTGYMARAAFLLDRLMSSVGLHGKAFMPLLSSFACAIPGIMATRTIENKKDRLATILIAPLMSCSARLPVYTLMIAAFFADRKVVGFISLGAILIMAMYLLGLVTALAVAWILKRTILKSPTPPLILELPQYRAPHWRTIVQDIWTRAGLFLKRAGTVILAISILLWALATFPRMNDADATQFALNERAAQVNSAAPVNGQNSQVETQAAPPTEEELQGARLRNSYAGRLGHVIEPVITPLGFDWKMGIALISSFAARETLVSTLNVIYNVGDSDAENNQSLVGAMRDARRRDGSPAWTPLVALTMMVFFVLAMQCMSTFAIVRRETNSWRWPLFMVAYMTGLAYIAALITYQGGRLLGFS